MAHTDSTPLLNRRQSDVEDVRRSLLPRVLRAHTHKEHIDSHSASTACLGKQRAQIAHFIEGHSCQMFLIGLIFLDVIFVMSEIFIAEFRQCVPDHHAENASCILEYPNHKLEQAEHVLHWFSFAIVVTFAVEIFFLIIAYGFAFFTKPLYVLDFVVVTVTIAVDIVAGQLGEVVGSLVLLILRMWRLVRIIHGTFLAAEERLKHAEEEWEQEKFRLEAEIRTQKDEIRTLRSQKSGSTNLKSE